MYKDLLLKYPNVNFVGRGRKIKDGKMVGNAIVCGVKQKFPLEALSEHEIIPSEVVDHRGVLSMTDVVEVGEIVAPRSVPQAFDRTATWRPAPGGVSIGHRDITAGTLGAWVYDNATGELLILSNNHVLANSNNAKIGDPILQQGPHDGGRFPDHHVANLHKFVEISFGVSPSDCPITDTIVKGLNKGASAIGSSHRLSSSKVSPQASNKVDAAVARAIELSVMGDPSILEIGRVTSYTKGLSLGMRVFKSGRTTEFTSGEIVVLDAVVNVSYGSAGTAMFEGQIITGAMSAGGDSGSLGVLQDGDHDSAFGLLFAGSDQVTIFNPIIDVLTSLNIRFAE
ncbi:MAG: hypothetical protein ACXAC2_00630 [Candidatus Kariarchaeaceae archaeon]|jgi:hypothetical protein